MTRSPIAFATVFCTVFSAIFAPQTASALSCLRPDITRSYNAAAQADERYIVLYGEFFFRESLNPASGIAAPTSPPASFVARFVGHYLSTEGFLNVVDIPITIQPECASVWCGRLASDTPSVAFVEMLDDGGYQIDVGPCPQWVFDHTTAQDLEQLKTCINGGTCEQIQR